MEQISHIVCLYELPNIRVVIDMWKICLTGTILIFIPQCDKFFVEKIPSLSEDLEDPFLVSLKHIVGNKNKV